jgi:alkanesulfonate monooxygenase SsuD/methylene tetrahydromethanopterin reductase-like flavin-dependent oxidoreductase (luciferase family)
MNSLLVGVGVTDRAAPGDDPVADAVTAEALGYDFVSAFDHPVADAATAEAVGYDAVPTAGRRRRTYPTYETWTLLTWIAARTTQIAIMPRVLGVPFRRPVLVAKAAESLQRLSGGRLILGLGAGYRDTEIRAVGAPALTPRARAAGLADALAITRAAWMQPAVSYHGTVYSVDDLDLEPKPTQPIPIWLGALGPRGLALTGRVADGWIPFMRFAGPARIPQLLDQVRAASIAAGRPADAVRAVYSVPVRLDPAARSTAEVITGSAADIIEQLHGFTELGFSGFDLIASRDQIRALGEDVLPALKTAQQQPQPSRSPGGGPPITRPGLWPRPATAISPAGPAPEPARARPPARRKEPA